MKKLGGHGDGGKYNGTTERTILTVCILKVVIMSELEVGEKGFLKCVAGANEERRSTSSSREPADGAEVQ